MSELKPCPFCGSYNTGHDERNEAYVCRKCHASGPLHDLTATLWNTRAPDWQDISTAPRDRKPILLREKDFITVGWWLKLSNGHPRWDWHGEGGINPTHWMPLPAPPKEVGQ